MIFNKIIFKENLNNINLAETYENNDGIDIH